MPITPIGDDRAPRRSTTLPTPGMLRLAIQTMKSKRALRALPAPLPPERGSMIPAWADRGPVVARMQSAHPSPGCCYPDGGVRTRSGTANSAATTAHQDETHPRDTSSGSHRRQHRPQDQRESSPRMNRSSCLREESSTAFSTSRLRTPPANVQSGL